MDRVATTIIAPVVNVDEVHEDKLVPFVSMATKDTATPEITCDLQTAEDSGRKSIIIKFVDEQLVKETTKFHEMLKKHN